MDADFPIVDAHHHLWDLGRNYYPWLSDRPEKDFFLGDYSALKRDFLPADYRRATQGYNVVATVHVEAEWDRSRQVAETEWLHEVAAETGMPDAVVGHAWLADDNCEEVLAGHAAFPLMRGIRSKPVTAPSPDRIEKGAAGTMQDPRWRAGFRLLHRYGLTYDLRVPFWHLPEAAEIAALCPETPMVLNHTGFPWDRSEGGLKAWREAMRIIAEAPHVSLKISELGLRDEPWELDGNRRVVLEAIDIFGIDRCMFASNLPVSALRADFATIVEGISSMVADFPREDREKLFTLNAARFYRLDLPASASR
ncbi:amidohydrolase family protein [Kaustia mangrovi]|uniref:Amidohydrolase family protein n=1 Tax=Kaustia mangrovi TaxID=2593653 RepID=A0A7S8C3J1_9HYPH|nr:amidohydrolase family protein [Kaustia mangrovi]QPC42710.1 amidohydrolase family protein [Kaustia mangrovi]